MTTISLFKTLYVPGLRCNLISTAKATDNNCKIVMFKNKAVIMRNGQDLIETVKANGLFLVQSFKSSMDFYNEASDTTTKEFGLWHKSYGHFNSTHLTQLQSKCMVEGLPKYRNQKIDCATCFKGKQIKDVFPTKNSKSSNEVLDLVHTD